MASHLVAVTFDANDPEGLAHFWGGVLGWETEGYDQDVVVLAPADDTGFEIDFAPTQNQSPARTILTSI